MTDEQKYAELIKEIGKLMHDKNTSIWVKDCEIKFLKAKLESVEKRIDELKRSELQ